MLQMESAILAVKEAIHLLEFTVSSGLQVIIISIIVYNGPVVNLYTTQPGNLAQLCVLCTGWSHACLALLPVGLTGPAQPTGRAPPGPEEPLPLPLPLPPWVA